MPAKVVNAELNAGVWIKAKPPDFKGKDLENALKRVEGIDVAIPDIKSKAPKLKLHEIEDCIKEMESDLAALKNTLAELNKIRAALQAVVTAADKTESELEKMQKGQESERRSKAKIQERRPNGRYYPRRCTGDGRTTNSVAAGTYSLSKFKRRHLGPSHRC